MRTLWEAWVQFDFETMLASERMEGAWYAMTRDRFEMPPIALSDWNEMRAEQCRASGSRKFRRRSPWLSS
jgi:hypothetical protein